MLLSHRHTKDEGKTKECTTIELNVRKVKMSEAFNAFDKMEK